MSDELTLAEIIAEKQGDVVAGLGVPYGHTIERNDRDEVVRFVAYNNYHSIDDAGIEQIATLGTLEKLDLSCGIDVTDRGLAHLASLPRLCELSLQSPYITNAGLAHLAGLPRLRVLSLSGERIGDAGLTHIAKLAQLISLEFHVGRLTKKGLSKLQNLRHLESLSVWRTYCGDAGLKEIGKLLSLRSLKLGPNDLTDRGLKHLDKLVALEEIDLCDNSEITDRGLTVAANWPRLKKLTLASTAIGDEGLKFLAGCALIESLHVGSTMVSDAGIAHLQGCTHLKELSLNATRITDVGLARLGALVHLESLDFDETAVTDVGLSTLAALVRLKRLSFCDTKITGQGLANLAHLAELKKIRHSGLPGIRLPANYLRFGGLDFEVDLTQSELVAYINTEIEFPVWMIDIRCTGRLVPAYRQPPHLEGPGFSIDARSWRELAPGEVKIAFVEDEHHPILPDNPGNFYNGEHAFPNYHHIRLLSRMGRPFEIGWTCETRRYPEDDPQPLEVSTAVDFKRVIVWSDGPLGTETARATLGKHFDPANFSAPQQNAYNKQITFTLWENVS